MGKDDTKPTENVTAGNVITGVTGTVRSSSLSYTSQSESPNHIPTNLSSPPQVGAVVGGVTRTTGGLVGATGKGVGGTINNASGTKPFGNAVQAVTDGVEYGVQAISRGIEDGSRGKRPGSTDSEWDHR